jgi:hypothetical protein
LDSHVPGDDGLHRVRGASWSYLTRYPTSSAFFGVGRTAAITRSDKRIDEVLDWLDLARVRDDRG